MRKLACLVIALVGVAIGACSGADEPTPTASEQASGLSEQWPASETPAGPMRHPGSYANPLPLGDSFQVGPDWLVTVHAADHEGKEPDDYGYEIEPGSDWIRLEVTVEYTGHDHSYFNGGDGGLSFQHVGTDQIARWGDIPADDEDLYPGGRQDVDVFVPVPPGAHPGGRVVVSQANEVDPIEVYVQDT